MYQGFWERAPLRVVILGRRVLGQYGLRGARRGRTTCQGVVLRLFQLLLLFLAAGPALHAHFIGRQTGCYNPFIVATPNRPTVANPANITQYGVLELEYGWDLVRPGVGARAYDFGGLLKFGLLCDVELCWTSTAFLSQVSRFKFQLALSC
jgi:hypothetical protein